VSRQNEGVERFHSCFYQAQCQSHDFDEVVGRNMKLLTSHASWMVWIKDEEGRFSDVQHPPPKKYPCFGYFQLESWSQESQRPIYLYQYDLDSMSIELMSIAQKM
jgi:hypothetical protein